MTGGRAYWGPFGRYFLDLAAVADRRFAPLDWERTACQCDACGFPYLIQWLPGDPMGDTFCEDCGVVQ